jgi:hypothetical protein
MVVKIAIDNNILGYLGETEESLRKNIQSKTILNEINRLEYTKAFARLVCSNPRIKGIVPLMVAYEFAKAPKDVRKRVFEKWADCFYWSNNVTIYRKARSLKIPNSLKHLKPSDIRIVFEATMLQCKYLVTYNRKDLGKEKNQKLIRSEFKSKFRKSPPKILTPEEFLSLLYIPKH